MSLIYERIYKKLMKVVPVELIEKMVESGKSKLGGAYMDLGYDYLYKDEKGNPVIALSHYYKHPSGDMIADPDMEIRVFKDMQMAEAMSYQDCYGYRVVYHDNGKKVDVKAKKDLNVFLNMWLGNLINQEHKIQTGVSRMSQKLEVNYDGYTHICEQCGMVFVEGGSILPKGQKHCPECSGKVIKWVR